MAQIDLNVGGIVTLDILKGVSAQIQDGFNRFGALGLTNSRTGYQKPITSTNTNKLNKTTNIGIGDLKEEAQIDNRLTSIPYLLRTDYTQFMPTLPGYTGGLITRSRRIFASTVNTAYGDVSPSKFLMDYSFSLGNIGSIGKTVGYNQKLNNRGFPFGNKFNLGKIKNKII